MGPHRKTQVVVLSKTGDDLLFAEVRRRVAARLEVLRLQRDGLQLRLIRAESEKRTIEAELVRLSNELYPPDYVI